MAEEMEEEGEGPCPPELPGAGGLGQGRLSQRPLRVPPTLRLGLLLWELPPCSRWPSRARHGAVFPWALASLRAACEAGLLPWVVLDGSSCPRLLRRLQACSRGQCPLLQGCSLFRRDYEDQAAAVHPTLDVGE